MHNERKTNIDKLKYRLQFIVVLFLFFPTFFEKVEGFQMKWGLMVAVLAIIFLLVELLEKYLIDWIIKWVNILLLCSAFTFVPILYIFAHNPTDSVSSITKIFILSDIVVLLVIPTIALILLLINLGILIAKKINETT